MFGPNEHVELGEHLIGTYLQIAPIARTMTVRSPTGPREGIARRVERLTVDGLVHTWLIVLEAAPGAYTRLLFARDDEVAVHRSRCATCAGQMFGRSGGPGHYGSGTCRMKIRKPHCTCAGCW